MRLALVLALVAGCHQLIDDGTPFLGPDDPAAQVDCARAGMPPTSVSGTVFMPGGILPLHDAVVYVPRELAEIADGAAAPACVTAPLVATRSGPRGVFRLDDVPAGGHVTLAIQLGKWRRVVTIPRVEACTDNPLPAELTRLPRAIAEGHLPRIALSTGLDALECLLREVGVDDAAFGMYPSTGRFQLFRGAEGTTAIAGRGSIPDVMELTGNPALLAQYDAVVLACEGNQTTATAAAAQHVFDYVAGGGQVWLSHFEAMYLRLGPPPWPTLATYKPTAANLPAHAIVTIDQSSPAGVAFADWLVAVSASAAPGQLVIDNGRHSIETVDPNVERWAYLDPQQPQALTGVQGFTWRSPSGGRVTATDLHLASSSTRAPFPQECTALDFVQARAIAYQLFAQPTCVSP